MITAIIILLVGIGLIIISTIAKIQINKIEKEGIETEGIIFSQENNNFFDFSVGYPVIRFVTNTKEWITETSKISLPLIYSKKQKVVIVYDPENPKDFFIKTKATSLILLTILLFGFAALIIGILRLLDI